MTSFERARGKLRWKATQEALIAKGEHLGFREIAGQAMHTYIDWMRSCWYVSMMAAPAISVPAGFTRDGLPVGLQIVGRPRDDLSVLQLSHAFELAAPHGSRRPSLTPSAAP